MSDSSFDPRSGDQRPADARAADSRAVDPRPAGRLVAWFGAALAGRVDATSALSAVQLGTDGHVVSIMNAWAGLGSEELTLDDVWPAVAASGVQGLALVLPVPGDPLGLVSTGAFAREALAAEVGVVLVTEQLRIGWVPEPDLRGSSYRGVRWRVYAEPLGDGVAPGALPGDAAATGADDPNRIVEQADRALSRSLRAATDALAGLDLATWRPEVAAGRTEAEAALHAAAQLMPPAWPLPARALAERALALWRVVQIARADPGAASASGSLARAETLGMLSHAVREAAMAAYNVPASTMTRAATRGTRGHTQPESARHRPT